MCWWRIRTSEAALWLVLLFISLEEAPGTTSSLGTLDKNDSQSRTTWCQKTNACAGCEGTKRPRCLKHLGQPLLGADLCKCCFSCVALRDLGESCGSQLSTWPEYLGSDPSSSSVTILSTTRCREGLVCVNFSCLEPATSSWLSNDEEFADSEDDDDDVSEVLGQDEIPFQEEGEFPTAERYQRTTSPPWEPILVNHDHGDFPKAISSTPTPSPTKSRQSSQPCYAKPEETATVSFFPSDETLGRVATTTLDDKRFQLVYNGDLLSELKVLLDSVDTFHEDSLLDENSLLNSFLAASSFPLDPRKKREVEVAGLSPPENIQEILIRGASAHREYVDGFRGYDRDSNVLDKNLSTLPGEATSQEDESTVRLQITNRPRKVQTVVDLEDDEVAVHDLVDEDNHDLQSTITGHAKDTKGKETLSPFGNDQIGAFPAPPKPFGSTRTMSQNTAVRKTTRVGPPMAPQVETARWSEALESLSDRLTTIEVRLNFFEKVLEEITKWGNHGTVSVLPDCVVPQVSEIRFGRRGPEPDEHLVLASGIDPVKIRGNRRKPNGSTLRRGGFHDTKTKGAAEVPGTVATRQTAHRGQEEPKNRNFFRALMENGSPRRPATSGRRGLAKSLCRNAGDRRSPWGESGPDTTVDEKPTHRTVQRSVSSNSSGLDVRRAFLGETEPRDRPDDQGLPSLQETQIPLPGIMDEEVRSLRDRKEWESSTLEDIFPGEWASAVEIAASRDVGRGEMLVLDEKEDGDEMGGSGAEKTTKRSKRGMNRVDGGQTASDSSRRAGELFQRETKKDMEPDPDREQRGVPGPLIVNGDHEFRNTPEPMASRLLFRNSEPDDSEDSRSLPYSITNHGNSTIRIEEISETEYDDSLPQTHGEDDFDHIYESVESGVEDEDFEYDLAMYDQVEYVDGSSVEMVTEVPLQGEWEPEVGLRSRGGIGSVISPRGRGRRASRYEDDQCGSAMSRPAAAKREIPLLLFGSGEKHEPKTIVWPSKWTGYQRDRILGSGRSGNPSTPNPTTMPSMTTDETERLVVQQHIGNGEAGQYVATTKISGLDRRAKKNRRKLVWR